MEIQGKVFDKEDYRKRIQNITKKAKRHLRKGKEKGKRKGERKADKNKRENKSKIAKMIVIRIGNSKCKSMLW